MKASLLAIIQIIVVLLVGVRCFSAGSSYERHLDRIQLPSGFRIQIYAQNLPDARSMALSPKGTLFVGTRKAGKVYAVLDRDQDGAIAS